MKRYINCTEHMWPSGHPGRFIRTIGSVSSEQCNNCLAVRLTFETTIAIGNGNWSTLTETRVVEPNFSPT